MGKCVFFPHPLWELMDSIYLESKITLLLTTIQSKAMAFLCISLHFYDSVCANLLKMITQLRLL